MQNIVKILICDSKQLISVQGQLFSIFHNNSYYWQQWSKPLSIVDRLPREIKAHALFSFDRRGHLHQRLHFQEGLETPVKAVIEMEATTRNREIKKPLTVWTRSMDRNGLFDNCTKDLNKKVILTWMKRAHKLKQ